jgi:DNA-binding MurR/RpiR family transcriptional regulator
MKLIEKIQEMRETASANDRKICDLFLKDPAVASQYTITQAAGLARVSVAAVQRFCMHLGLSGYKEFHYAMTAELRQKPSENNEDAMNILLQRYQDTLEDMKSLDRQSIRELADDLRSGNRIFLLGRYRNSLPVQKLYTDLIRLGIPAMTGDNVIAYENLAYLMDDQSICVLFSVNADFSSYKETMEHISSSCKRVWLITCSENTRKDPSDLKRIVLPHVPSSSGMLEEHAVMMIFDEILTFQISSGKI